MSSYRPWGSTDNGQIEFESLTDATLEGALDVLRKSFFLYESVCIGVDLKSEPKASTDFLKLCLDAAKDGVSAVAIDVNINKVVGVSFNKIQIPNCEKSFFEHFKDNCKYKSSKALLDFMINVDSRINLFEHYNVDCILEIMFLATLPDYGKRRIGELLVSTSLEIGKELKNGNNVKMPVMINGSCKIVNADKVPSLVSCIMTCNHSQKIASRLRFDQLLKVPFDEFEFNGKKFSERIGQENRDCTLVAKKLILT